MDEPFVIRIYENQQLVHSAECTGPVELGRQSRGEEQAYTQKLEDGNLRVVIASLDENTISRRHVLVEPLPNGRMRITNLSARQLVRLIDGSELTPQASCEITLPTVLNLGAKTVRLQRPHQLSSEGPGLYGLVESTRPGKLPAKAPRLTSLTLHAEANVEIEAIIGWLQAAMGVLHSAASSDDFFAKAAQAVVDIVGLDSGRVLLLDEAGGWKAKAEHSATQLGAEPNWQPSRQILNRMRQEKRTFWRVPGQTIGDEEGSLAGVKAVVASPILDEDGQVIGALYGDCRQPHVVTPLPRITRLEAMLVELIASGVAAGLARLEHEKAALAARVQFEQFFTSELARQLAVQPDLLKGRACEVTLLFCDIRAFSKISERLGAAGTVEWISDIMGVLSDCVFAHKGVLVDYIGDELMAMWGAPDHQPDHARLACRAALAMLDKLPELNLRWESVLQEPISLGIGINSGEARVGNTGSHRKFKYGPLGHTVNLASRVQGATKYLKCKLLITGATHAQLDSGLRTRRLCTARVVNIQKPVDLYELVPPDHEGWADLQPEYENALQAFERQEFRMACRILGNLIPKHPNDGPALVLMSRAVHALVEEPAHFDPVWNLPGK